MASISQVVTLPLPALPEGWSAEKDFKAVGKLSGAVQRSIEPVGPHFLAHARRARHKRTFSEDDRIQAEDPMLLQLQAKDWKVRRCQRHIIDIQ
jgi:DnaJ family protein C protein 2